MARPIGSQVTYLPDLPDDTWLLWPAIAIVAITACLALLCQIPGIVSFVLPPLLLAAFPFVAIVVLLVTLRLFWSKRYRRAASIVFAGMLPFLLWGQLVWLAPYLHLGVSSIIGYGQPIRMYGSLHSSLRPAPFAVYDWSVGFAGSNDIFLIYDATDEIALPVAKHQHPSSFEEGWSDGCAGKVRHLLRHYYLCYFD